MERDVKNRSGINEKGRKLPIWDVNMLENIKRQLFWNWTTIGVPGCRRYVLGVIRMILTLTLQNALFLDVPWPS